jgi:hypothetical protein
MIPVERFVRLSETLTGIEPLNRTLAAQYLDRLVGVPEAKSLPLLASTVEQILAARGDTDAEITHRILGDEDLRALTKIIVLVWYLGDAPSLKSADQFPQHHFQGRFWDVIHAHPPALSGGYFGHWAYPPDN